MISIIIPAHNEEAVIARCLFALLDGAEPGELEVIVACNGCRDRTAEKARAMGPAVQVIELEEASKTAAINAAELVATAFPRLYVDADVVLTLQSARRVAAALESKGALLASPVPITDFGGCSAAVRAYYDIWRCLPYNQVMVGTGVYALSREGRARFGRFPPIIADDGFVRSRFAPPERVAVSDAEVTVRPPRSLSELVNVSTRSRLGLYQLACEYPHSQTADRKDPVQILSSLPRGVGLPWRLGVYLWVNVVTRYRARRLLCDLSTYTWHRDDSSRLETSARGGC